MRTMCRRYLMKVNCAKGYDVLFESFQYRRDERRNGQAHSIVTYELLTGCHSNIFYKVLLAKDFRAKAL